MSCISCRLPGLREEAARELRLGLDESSDSRVAAAAFQVVAEQCILLQQDNLEALAATVRKHKYKLLNVAGMECLALLKHNLHAHQ